MSSTTHAAHFVHHDGMTVYADRLTQAPVTEKPSIVMIHVWRRSIRLLRVAISVLLGTYVSKTTSTSARSFWIHLEAKLG